MPCFPAATVDDSLPFIMNILLANIASLAGVLAVLALTQPVLLALLLPLGIMYRWVPLCQGRPFILLLCPCTAAKPVCMG
jgi:hypothetical protein